MKSFLRSQKVVHPWIGDHHGHPIRLRVLNGGREQRLRIERGRVGNHILIRDPERYQIVREIERRLAG